MSITFGSVGDIIAVGQIAWSLAQALTDSKGSAKEYQGLVKELRAFERAVLQIVALWQNYDCPDVITIDVVKDWLDTLRAFQEKVYKKYGTSLGVSGSGNWAKDVSKKLIWLKEKEDILDLRRKLNSASDTITMLTIAAMGKSNKLAESAITFRVRAVHFMLADSKKRAEEQAAQIKAMDDKIDVQSRISDLILCNVNSGNASLTQVHSMTVDIKNILDLFQSHMESQQSTPWGLGTGWQQNPVTLEDALGLRITIPLEIVTSWKILNLILLERFENHPGYRKVLKGEFAIEDAVTGRDLNRETKLTMCFRPGQKVDMSMVFSGVDNDSNRCPRCSTKSEASAEARTQCTSCTMWFQRLVEIDDDSESRPILRSTERPGAARSGERTKKRKDPVSTPADFQRVRLMRILRLKERKAKDARDKAYANPDYSIFVGSLGPEVNEYVLVSLFGARFTSCKSAKIMTHPATGMSRGYGFVRFADESDQQRALTEMYGVYCGNRPMRISTVTPNKTSLKVRM